MAVRRRPRTMYTRTPSLILEQRIDTLFGVMLRTLRTQSGLSIESLSHLSGFAVEELEDHELGVLPVPMSRLAVLLVLLADA
jgi:hypothetical protein